MASANWLGLRDWTRSTAGLQLSQHQIDQLQTHLELLLLWNRKMALVSQSDPVVIVAKHFADALFVAGQCANGETVADLGSGAGFPGLSIAIARPRSRVCLMESRRKKATFLAEVARIAGIDNAVVYHGRIEAAAGDRAEHAHRYQVATARALTSTAAFWRLAVPLLAPAGRGIVLKSARDEEASPSGCTSATLGYQLPDGTARKLVILRREEAH
jgi:16S rRNA (guanine527-N7)-methyltransferase